MNSFNIFQLRDFLKNKFIDGLDTLFKEKDLNKLAFFLSNFYSKLINELRLDIKFIEDEKFKYPDYNFLILELEKCLDNVGLNLKHNYGYNQSLHYHLGDYCRFINRHLFGLIKEKEIFYKR